MEKYFNDAVIGNKNVKASFSRKGELLRLFYPNQDFKQFIDFWHTGVKINDSGLIYLHDDVNNLYNQYYTENTNVLNTEIVNTYFKLKIIQTDFAPMNHNVLIKKYKFINQNNIDLNLNYIIHSKLLTNENNQVTGYCKDNSLLQYTHDYNFCTFSKDKIASSQINNTKANIAEGHVYDKDYVGMSEDSSISYELKTLKPKEELELVIFIYVDKNEKSMDAFNKDIDGLRKIDVKEELDNTIKYWKKYLKDHDGIELDLPQTPKSERIQEIYKRTILLYPLLTNYETGGISAAIEVDEGLEHCGRYAYCWPRDAVFITKAMDILKMEKDTEKFYKTFCKNAQSKSGMWEQRFYTDGRLAPCWGYQIDETASVVCGVYDHFTRVNDKKFLKDNFKMCEKAVKFLERYLVGVEGLTKENDLPGTGMPASYDLWEMYEGVHLYSLASIFSAFDSMLKIYKEMKDEFTDNRLKQETIAKQKNSLEKRMVEIKEFILKNLYDENKKSFIRSAEDEIIDISMLGAVYPFNMFTAKEKKILNTVERINLTLRTYTGGYQRFENDHYMGGKPWVIATLWMALYYIEINDTKKAKECFDFVVNTAGKHGFLAEQVDNSTMKPAWVIGLAWSHAMFILVLEKLYGKEK
ncbi:MAG: hypothetical protein FWC79_08465 [Oscillospiraceae bacterium]|nr:hypothetical protein [Oscillospiraceae bacterium]